MARIIRSTAPGIHVQQLGEVKFDFVRATKGKAFVLEVYIVIIFLELCLLYIRLILLVIDADHANYLPHPKRVREGLGGCDTT